MEFLLCEMAPFIIAGGREKALAALGILDVDGVKAACIETYRSATGYCGSTRTARKLRRSVGSSQ